jgi:carbon-monoxide dehydrogenase large subunit
METCGSLADYDRATGKLTVYMTSQAPHIVRAAVAMVAELPEQNIRIVTPDIGGGFGNKVPIYPGYVIAILASILTEKPVKWIEDKTGNLTSTGFGRDVYLKGEMAMRKDGKILGVRMNTISDHGAFFADAQPSKFKIGLMHSAFAAYDIPTAHMFATGYYTNKAPGGVAYRCSFRVTEAMFFQERMVQAAADDLGMDQAEFRRINFVKDEQHPHRTAFGFLTDSGQYEKCLDIGLEALGYKNFAAEKAEAAQRGRLLGIGISTMTEPLGAGNSREYDILGIKMFDSAELRIHMSGKALLRTGSRGQGTGHETTWAQIVAHELGIPADDILVEEGDTDTAPFGMGTYASRSTPVAGAAIAMVARKVRAKARKLAAHLLEVSEEDIEWELGRFYVRGNQERGVTIQECAMAAYSNMPDGMEPGLENVAYYDPPNLTWPFACYIAKVEIDPETGVWDVLQFVAVDDCGVRINPMIVEGQIMGGLTEAYAMANMQYQTYDEEGNIIGGNYMDFLLPTAWETPGFELYEVVTPCPHHPIGAKGVGECATVGGPAAFVNAVMDALKDKGVRNIDMPLMPNRVYEALTTGKDVYGMPPVRSGN